jgi:hypothetical protein
VIPRAIDQIFTEIANTTVNDPSESTDSTVEWLTVVSFLELYNEKIFDLLGQGSKVNLDIRETAENGFYVPNLSKHVVTNREEILQLIHKGNSNRFVAATSQNEVSSRSHSMLIVYMEKNSVNPTDNSSALITASKINIVDLAGSERLSSNVQERQGKETLHINLSLSTLALVINALTEGAAHIPYRDSKLTKLLKDALGGNSYSLLIACINAADYNAQETLSTLRYASRAKKIKNKPKMNEDPKDAILRGLHEEIFALKQLIAQKNTLQLQMFHIARELSQPEAIKKRINFLQKCLAGNKSNEINQGNRTVEEDGIIIGNDPLPLNFETSEEVLKSPTRHPLVDQMLASLIPAQSAPLIVRINEEKENSNEEAKSPRDPTSEPSTPLSSSSSDQLTPSFDSTRHPTPSHYLYQLYLHEISKIYHSLNGHGKFIEGAQEINQIKVENSNEEKSNQNQINEESFDELCKQVNQTVEEEKPRLEAILQESPEFIESSDDSALSLLAQMPPFTPSDAAAQFDSLTSLCYRLAGELAEAKKSNFTLKSDQQRMKERFEDLASSKLELIKISNQELDRMKQEIDEIEVEIQTVQRNSVSMSTPNTPIPGRKTVNEQPEEKSSCIVQ